MIFLISDKGIDGQAVARELKEYGFENQIMNLGEVDQIPEDAIQCVLLLNKNPLNAVQRDIEKIRYSSPLQVNWWLCCVKEPDNRLFKKLEFTHYLNPFSENYRAFAERIIAQLACSLPKEQTQSGNMVGISNSMAKIRKDVRQLSKTKYPILILGETGTGKGVLAREIAGGDLIAINCAELSKELAPSQLFGHVRGAFSGAISDRKGALLAAKNGYVFLDEIGEVELELQSRLLYAFERKVVLPVGSDVEKQINCRIILATNRNLEKEVAEKRFRDDLFQRMSYFPLKLPSLYERRVDILLLAKNFLDSHNLETQLNLKMLDETANLLFNYHWPGNIRELHRVVTRAAVYSEDETFINHRIVAESQKSTYKKNEFCFSYDLNSVPWRVLKRDFQIDYILKLEASSKDIDEALLISGLSKSSYYKLKSEVAAQEGDR